MKWETIIFIVFVVVMNGGAALYREWNKRKAAAAAQAQRARDGGAPAIDNRAAERRAARKAQKTARVQSAIRANMAPPPFASSTGARSAQGATPPPPVIPLKAGVSPVQPRLTRLAPQETARPATRRTWNVARLRDGFIASVVMDKPRGADSWRPVA